MFLQQVAEGFVGQLLEVHHAVTRKQVEGVPRLVIELDSLASHLSALTFALPFSAFVCDAQPLSSHFTSLTIQREPCGALPPNI
jgi:hypothetical protein